MNEMNFNLRLVFSHPLNHGQQQEVQDRLFALLRAGEQGLSLIDGVELQDMDICEASD